MDLSRRLLDQMDVNGVDRATIVCAQIHRNPTNNDYVAAAVRKHPDRLEQFADVDSFWSDTYHMPGAAKRLEQAAEKLAHEGVHSVRCRARTMVGGSILREGKDFFSVARDVGLIASMAIAPHHQNEIRKVAEAFPEVPFLCHHMSALKSYGDDAQAMVNNVTESAKLPNIHLKLSGFHYLCQPGSHVGLPVPRDALGLRSVLRGVRHSVMLGFGLSGRKESDDSPAVFRGFSFSSHLHLRRGSGDDTGWHVGETPCQRASVDARHCFAAVVPAMRPNTVPAIMPPPDG